MTNFFSNSVNVFTISFIKVTFSYPHKHTIHLLFLTMAWAIVQKIPLTKELLIQRMILSRLRLPHGNGSVSFSSLTDGPFPNNVNIIYLPPKNSSHHWNQSQSQVRASLCLLAPSFPPALQWLALRFWNLDQTLGNRLYLGPLSCWECAVFENY